MITLSIEDFSCIKSARMEIAPVTVLIGPQGSGKSVTTKLVYFFIDTLLRQYLSAERGVDLDDFKKEASRQFRAWFPPAAWGRSRFIISFSAGPFTVRALRRMSRNAVTDDVAITFSEFFNSQYNELIAAYQSHRAQHPNENEAILRHSEAGWRIRERSGQSLSKALGGDYVGFQTFVPAGRAFFTSIGRLVAAIEQGSSLDPVTIRFAKLFASLRDQGSYRLYRRPNPESRDERQARMRVMRRLFGGEIRFEGDQEFVETSDGRKVPFTALSSGQQELLPMWLLIEFFSDRDSDSSGELFYIEEPEAHLFPAAQSLLMDYLIGNLVSKRLRRSLILTTHSPYILSKLNNYLKAGSLGKIRKNVAAVSQIVPRECWLTSDRVKAYSIENGRLKELIDCDGLIDAHYIDEVSEEVSRDFNALLDIQYPETAV